ncbi:Putative glycosyltransferase EpsD [Thermoflexales bacterium]|nr:Putative glycosyltransferase EpsD [Thermoflexales bacterium]
MRLSFVLSSLQLSGGVQVVVEYANRLATRGHLVTLITPRGMCAPEIRQRIARDVTICESAEPPSARRNALTNLRLLWSLWQALPPSDVIIATHTPTIMPVCLATLGHRAQRAWLYMDYAEMFQARPLEGWLLRHGPRWFDRLATLSEASRVVALRTGARQATVIGLGLTDAERFVPKPRLANVHPIAMYLGDGRPRKGLADFLAAAEIVRRSVVDLHLLLVTKDRPELKTALPYAHVVKPDEITLPDLYRSADVFVSASWGEGFGLPPLEAMACGVPVVLTDSGGVRDYARSGENCSMVPVRDVTQLAAAIVHVLSDREYAQRIGRAGVLTAARFQWEVCVERLEAVLRA